MRSRGRQGTPPVARRTPQRRAGACPQGVDTRVKELLHQLQVHQAELEAQNEELRRVQAQLAAALDRYTELYDAAPVGYLTLDTRARITQMNHAAAALLGLPANAELPVAFSRFLPRRAVADWRSWIDQATRSPVNVYFDLEIRPEGGNQLLPVHVSLSTDPVGHTLRVVLSDLSDSRALAEVARAAALSEHERMSADIHDGLSQDLAGLSLSLRSIETRAATGDAPTAADFALLNEITTQAITSCRAIVRGLSPVGDNEGGLLTALRNLVDRADAAGGVPIEFETTGRARIRLSLGTADHLFRIAQEALTNARKHGQASRIRVSLDVQRTAITLQVDDDGVGYGARPRSDEGSGLRLMRFRAAAIHANLSCEALPQGGTRVRCVCPHDDRTS